MTITEFLLARIAEDEAVATRVVRRNPGRPTFSNNDYGLLLVQPARVLAECAAKRRIVEWHTPVDDEPDGWCNNCDGDVWPCVTMAALATVYADHPDYDQAWGL